MKMQPHVRILTVFYEALAACLVYIRWCHNEKSDRYTLVNRAEVQASCQKTRPASYKDRSHAR